MAFNDVRAPERLHTDEFLLRPILGSDAELDYEAVMESKEFLRVWAGESWPEDDFAVEDNSKDMEKMEGRHNERHSFGYTVMNLAETQCLGCVYIVPTDVSWMADTAVSAVGDAQWSEYDTVVLFWVRKSRLADELDRRLLDALGPWLKHEWPIKDYVIMTSEALTQQVAMIEGAELKLKFRLKDPNDTDGSVAYTYPPTRDYQGLSDQISPDGRR